MENRWGLLVSLAVGDASGADFEFKSKEVLDQFCPDFYPRGTGTYTDDTNMSIAVARHMIDRCDISVPDYAEYFHMQYRQDPERQGFSRRTRAALEEENSKDFLTSCVSHIPRDTNGCVMRVLPIGYYRDVERVKQAALTQCIVTHPYLDCVIASQFLALTAHYYIYRSDECNVEQFLWRELGISEYGKVFDSWSLNNKEGVPCNAMKTVAFCYKTIKLCLAGASMTAVLEGCIKQGGDVDSLAAICLGLASLNKKIDNDLPDALYDNLENGQFGRDYLESLDVSLQKLSN